MKKLIKKKVLIGLSGGVDSSVAAALLQEEGFEVLGIFLRFWKSSEENYIQDKKNLSDVKKVAETLGIKLIIKDVRQRFKDEVVKYFLEGYQKGETPNPCVFCNKNLKFRLLFEEMVNQDFDFVATGHYARIFRNKNGKFELFEGLDKKKDQSYFLYTLNQKELSRILFPLGEFRKEKIKRVASKLKLSSLNKKESQDICFLKNEGIKEFLQKNLKMKKGKIISEKGKILGFHKGLPLYTLGQRKGIGVGGRGPYFVFGKNRLKNELRVTTSENEDKLQKRIFFLSKENWIDKKPKENKRLFLRTRYRNKLVSGIIKRSLGKTKVILQKSRKAITPGQSVVFYDSEGKVLGGGIIKD